MARAFTAKKSSAGKEIKCGRCGEVIKAGETYSFFSVGFRGSKQYRCFRHRPKQSELCGSKMSGAYAANEELEAAADDGTIEEIGSALETAAEAIESVRDEYQESYDNLPENFQNGSQGGEIQEKIDGLDEYANSLRDAASEVQGLEACETDEELRKEEEDTLLDEAREKVEDVVGEFSL